MIYSFKISLAIILGGTIHDMKLTGHPEFQLGIYVSLGGEIGLPNRYGEIRMVNHTANKNEVRQIILKPWKSLATIFFKVGLRVSPFLKEGFVILPKEPAFLFSGG